MSRALIAGVIAAAVVITVLWSWRTRGAGAATEVTAPAPAAPASADAPSTPEPPAGLAAQPPQPQSTTLTLEQRFQGADDLLTFVETVRDAASAGDGASAWWIYRALRRCDIDYKLHFLRNRRIRTLDEALQINAGNPAVPMEETRKLHGQCARLREAGFAGLQPETDWLKSAAHAGVPPARMEMARAMIFDTSIESPPGVSRRDYIRQLAFDALRSKDPEVVLAMADVAHTLGTPAADFRELEWVIAACQRGLDCSPGSALAAHFCRGDTSCQPYEGVEAQLRRILSGEYEYDDFERRAREINQLIDQDRFDELGAWMAAR